MLFQPCQSFSREFKLLFDEDHTVEIEISYLFCYLHLYSSVSICTHRKPRPAAVSEINVLVHRFQPYWLNDDSPKSPSCIPSPRGVNMQPY